MQRVDDKLFNYLNTLFKEKHSNNFIVDIGSSYNSYFLKYNGRYLIGEDCLNIINEWLS